MTRRIRPATARESRLISRGTVKPPATVTASARPRGESRSLKIVTNDARWDSRYSIASRDAARARLAAARASFTVTNLD